MRIAPTAVVLAALALACAGSRSPRAPAAPAAPERRAFAVPGNGEVEILVPAGWEVTEREGEPGAAPVIELAPEGRPVALLLMPLGELAGASEEAADTAQLLVELARRSALAGSVEKEIPLMELVGDSGVHGYWFTSTDRALEGREPSVGEYRYMLQGAAAVGSLVLAFRLVDNEPGPHREQVLELVRSARHRTGVEPGPGDLPDTGAMTGFVPDPDVQTVPLVVEVPGRRFSVLVDLPGFVMFAPRDGDEGQGRIVLGKHPETDIVASVVVRELPAAAPARCRDEALARIRRAAPELADLRMSDGPASSRLSYGLAELRGRSIRQEHVHAFLGREGVCVNLHLSKAEPDPEDPARFEEILSSLRYGESL